MSCCRGASSIEVERIVRDAIPKPSRAVELYAALTLSIVLLRDRIEEISLKFATAPKAIRYSNTRRTEKELETLLRKRDELESSMR